MKLLQLFIITSVLTFETSALKGFNKRAWDYGTSDITNYFKNDKDESTKSSEEQQTKESPIPEEPKLSPCSSTNPLTGGFFDLSELSSINQENIVAWSAKGHDYNKNFTLGVCSSPLKPNVEVNNNFDGHFAKYQINSSEVGGFYVDEFGDKFSIGNFNSTPVFRGRKLTLSYHNGSYCPNGIDKKSTLLSFICDREILSKATVSFVGVLHDCDYFFEVRTVHACPTAQKADNLALIWIFLFM
ncbi:putative mannose 6-phosphate receptor-like protein [Wickerhamomyces ciferrii]|uniref:Mannose 6-phosphate receptor-like protein n=1 Tax=Wickerhamomyces ciferrii (strain ATCC 14091 / BCRC 22168 / CBS 111 / JCM 3599 / NBRC 0793 / NRRL Y-1031 F-60-10) TaxID=1206466 RepID=K0KY54_WICCF|nr:putative mannose 6-phosphate receptor-like protein [Wickerhamomyces ciferrii]CCH46033.1 putative mannose 6-phosphate receptor-like protein [Wickerhamomyces ciferrii]